MSYKYSRRTRTYNPLAHSGDGIKDYEFRQRRSERESNKRMRDLNALVRRQARSEKQAQREAIALQKDKLKQLQESILQNVEEKNREIADNVKKLQTILEHTLFINDTITFDSLKDKKSFPPFSPPIELTKILSFPDRNKFAVKPLNWFSKLLPSFKERHKRKVQEASEQYNAAIRNHEKQKAENQNKLERLKKEYEEQKETFHIEAQKNNQRVDDLKERYYKGDLSAVVEYCGMVLERSDYPDNFPKEFALDYTPEKKFLKIEYEIPPVNIIPTIKEYKYIKSKNDIKEIIWKDKEIISLYKDVVLAIALRTLHEIIESDQASHIDEILFSGYLDIIDQSTGKKERVCLISVETTKKIFNEINLRLIDKAECLKSLGAKISPTLNKILIEDG